LKALREWLPGSYLTRLLNRAEQRRVLGFG
jgi:hypothetical protein